MEATEHSSELGRWQSVQRAADPRLRAWVQGYFASSSNLHVAVRERHLPATDVHLLLNFAAPHRRLDASGDWSERDGVWVVGLHDGPQLSEAMGERQFMAVSFTPAGAHRFLRLPMHLIANQAIDLAAIDPVLAHRIMGRVGAARGWTDRFAAMDALIAERLGDGRTTDSIGLAWRRLLASDGRVALGSVAAELDCSHRTLIARFRTSVGFPPKTIARLLRFNRALRALESHAQTRADAPAGKPYIEDDSGARRRSVAVPWADIAAACGYFDQAHFIREFREFSGSPPTAFLRQVSSLS